MPQKTTGIDVSSHSGIPNYAAVKAAGYAFVIPRTSYGTTVDSLAAKQVKAARAAGLWVLAGYHYFKSDVDPLAQAAHAVKVMRDLDLPAVLPDVEPRDPQIPSDAPSTTRPLFLAHRAAIAELSGVDSVYGGSSYLASLQLPPELGAVPLWLAHYGAKSPTIPKPWTTCAIWQYAGNVQLAGAKVDLNSSAHTLVELQAMFAPKPAPAAPKWDAPYEVLSGVATVAAQASGHGIGGAEDFRNIDEGPPR